MTKPFDWYGDESPDPPETCITCDGDLGPLDRGTTCRECRDGYELTCSRGYTTGGVAIRRGRSAGSDDYGAIGREGEWDNGVRELEDGHP